MSDLPIAVYLVDGKALTIGDPDGDMLDLLAEAITNERSITVTNKDGALLLNPAHIVYAADSRAR